jgi:hypothetical protein
MLISTAQWAAQHGYTPVAARKLIERGKLPEAIKIGRNWTIDNRTPWPADHRCKNSPSE